MHQVKGEYPDFSKSNLKSNFYLDADQGFNQSWSPPIQWTGIVGGTEVSFTQIDASGFNKEYFDWTGFPDKLSLAIPYIVEAIDEAMRTMD